MDWVVEDKKTGEIYTVLSISYGGFKDEIRYTLMNSSAVEKNYGERVFKERFKKVSFDFTKLISIAAQSVDTCESARKLLYPIARRIHPGGYYQVGCLVYFEYGEFLDGSPVIVDRSGKRTTFIVIEICDGSKYRFDTGAAEDCLGYIKVARYRGPGVPIEKYKQYGEDYCLPLGKDIMFSGDAYNYLKRYDQPY